MTFLNEARKFIVAFVGALLTLVAQGFISGDAAKWVTIIVVFLTSFGVYVTPNQPPSPQPPDNEGNH